eukprot:768328-Hanusia_phi.AAC.3
MAISRGARSFDPVSSSSSSPAAAAAAVPPCAACDDNAGESEGTPEDWKRLEELEKKRLQAHGMIQ